MKSSFSRSSAVILIALIALAGTAFTINKPCSKNPEAQQIIDQVWNNRDAEWTVERIDREVKLLDRALALDPDNYDLILMASQYYFDRGMVEEEKTGAKEKAKQYYQKGAELAERALAIKETSAAHYLAAINQGAAVKNDGIVGQVLGFREIIAHMDWIGNNDKHFGYGAWARFWLDCHMHAPEKIISMVGVSREEACTTIDDEIQREPRYLENYYYKLKACTDPADEGAQLSVLDTALNINPDSLPDSKSTNNYFHKRFEQMWKEKTGKDHR